MNYPLPQKINSCIQDVTYESVPEYKAYLLDSKTAEISQDFRFTGMDGEVSYATVYGHGGRPIGRIILRGGGGAGRGGDTEIQIKEGSVRVYVQETDITTSQKRTNIRF